MTGSAPRSGDWRSVARAAAAHVFVDDIGDPQLTPDDLHHLTRVLRVRPGQTVSVADGTGGWRAAAFVTGGALDALGDAVWPDSPTPLITVAMAMVKGDRPEWAVQKLAEIGVDRIIPLVTARAVVRWDAERGAHHLARWRAVARQAAMQSRCLRVPVIEEPASPADLVARDGARAALAEPGGGPPRLERPIILIGPEGGWAPEELAAGLPTVGLLPTVLRTETAAVVAGALLASLRAASDTSHS